MNVFLNFLEAIGFVFLGAFITHLFYKQKLKQKQRVDFQTEIGNEIVRSILKVRDIVKKSEEIDVYNIEEELYEQGEKFDIDNAPIYPSIMENKESFMKFHEEIVTARSNYGNNLTIDVAVYLWYSEKYFNHLMMFITNYKEVYMPTIGAIFIKDIQEWQREFDNVIVNNINTYPVKLELHDGKKWGKRKEKILSELWDNSLLNKMINDKDSSDLEIAWQAIDSTSKK